MSEEGGLNCKIDSYCSQLSVPAALDVSNKLVNESSSKELSPDESSPQESLDVQSQILQALKRVAID